MTTYIQIIKRILPIIPYILIAFLGLLLWIYLQKTARYRAEIRQLVNNQSSLLQGYDSANTLALTLTKEQAYNLSEIARLKGIKPKRIETVQIIKGESKLDTVIAYDTVYIGLDTIKVIPFKSKCFVGEIRLQDSAEVSLAYTADFEVLVYKKRVKGWFGKSVADFFTFRWGQINKHWEYRSEILNKCDSYFQVDTNLSIRTEK